MDDLRIRTATPSDLDTVLAFWRKAAEGVSISDDRDGVVRLIARAPGALLLAECASGLAGTVIAGFDDWRCHLYRLAVHPAHRRQGVATALLKAAEDRFTALGGRRGDAMVLDRNELAHPAWSAAGYIRQPEWSRWVKPLIPTSETESGQRRAPAPTVTLTRLSLPILYHRWSITYDMKGVSGCPWATLPVVPL